jgi:hypothetical protein
LTTFLDLIATACDLRIFHCFAGIQNKPTVPQFVTFRTANGESINLAERIGTDFFNFGILLLKDDTGSCVSAARKQYRGNAEDINTNSFTLWLDGKGRRPVTWATLVGVLRDMRLFTLAEEIEDALL